MEVYIYRERFDIPIYSSAFYFTQALAKWPKSAFGFCSTPCIHNGPNRYQGTIRTALEEMCLFLRIAASGNNLDSAGTNL